MAEPINDGSSPLSSPPDSVLDLNEETSAQFSPTNSGDGMQPIKCVEASEPKLDPLHGPKLCSSIEEGLETDAPHKSKLLERIEELKMPSDDEMRSEEHPRKFKLLERIKDLEKPSDDGLGADDLVEEDKARDSIMAKPNVKTGWPSRDPSRQKASVHNGNASPKTNRRIVLTNRRKSAKEKKWEAPSVYTDPKSPLANADLRAMLLQPKAWDVLTKEERAEILALFPDETHVLNAGTESARPNIESLQNDDNFRRDCARYRENIELGRHDEEWLNQAWAAHEKHKRGDFDEHLEQQFEEDWEIEIPEEYRLKRSRPSIDSASSDVRRVSGYSTASEQHSDSSPAVPRKILEKLSLAGNSPTAEPNLAQDSSPITLKRKRGSVRDDNGDDDADELARPPKVAAESPCAEESVQPAEKAAERVEKVEDYEEMRQVEGPTSMDNFKAEVATST